MDIIQTLNSGKKREILIEELEIIKLNNIKNVRFNLCKYPKTELKSVLNNIAYALKFCKCDVRLFFDIPYPKNKNRIVDFSFKGENIIVNNIYEIFSDYNDYVKSCSKYKILMGIERIDPLLYKCGDIIYFGDGEGCFEIEEINFNRVVVRAINDFKIYVNKALSIGFVEEEDPFFYIDNVLNSIEGQITFFLSFCTEQFQIEVLRKKYGVSCKFVPKIELVKNIASLKELLMAGEGAMLARGDLFLLNDIKTACKYYNYVADFNMKANKELYVATDIMKSLDFREFPSRADITDILYAKKMCATYIILPYKISSKIELIIKIIKEIDGIYE